MRWRRLEGLALGCGRRRHQKLFVSVAQCCVCRVENVDQRIDSVSCMFQEMQEGANGMSRQRLSMAEAEVSCGGREWNCEVEAKSPKARSRRGSMGGWERGLLDEEMVIRKRQANGREANVRT